MKITSSDIAMCTDAGVRPGNEDCCSTLIAADGSAVLLALADGMGGQACGEIASEFAIQTLIKSFEKYGFGESEPLLEEAVTAAHERIQRAASADAHKEGMGTTLVAAVIEQDRVFIGHVGDSRAFQFRDGCVRRLTEDHLYIMEVLGLPESAAQDHPQGHVLAQALGADGKLKPGLSSFDIATGDILLLCSDGIHGVLTEPQMFETLQKFKLAEAVVELVKSAISAGSSDNCTAVAATVPVKR